MQEIDARELYVSLLKRALVCDLWPGGDGSVVAGGSFLRRALIKWLGDRGLQLMRNSDDKAREEGRDWPFKAQTMIGRKRLENLQCCVETVLRDQVPGDLIETGVWRGGATILMRGILKAWNARDRKVWVADSFEGLPPRDLENYPQDSVSGAETHKVAALAVSLEMVQENFRLYDLLDDQVCFLKGWFKDTLSKAPIERLAVARLDGDLYESTMDAIVPLYPKLSVGGFLIVDDYGDWPACRKAIDDYREKHGITEPIEKIDVAGIFWRKQSQILA